MGLCPCTSTSHSLGTAPFWRTSWISCPFCLWRWGQRQNNTKGRKADLKVQLSPFWDLLGCVSFVDGSAQAPWFPSHFHLHRLCSALSSQPGSSLSKQTPIISWGKWNSSSHFPLGMKSKGCCLCTTLTRPYITDKDCPGSGWKGAGRNHLAGRNYLL